MVKRMFSTSVYKEPNPKKSSSSANPSRIKTSSMNKGKKRSHKVYRSQGR